MIHLEPRPYRDARDLEAIRQVLVEGRRAGGTTHYVHVGDVAWWLFCLNQNQALAEHLFLWEEPDSGAPLGWALLSPNYEAFDVFAMPGGWASGLTPSMWAWAEARMAALVQPNGGQRVCTLWVGEHDAQLRGFLVELGFHQTEYCMIHTEQALVDELEEPSLPAGFHVRGTRGPADAAARATASFAAFRSALLWDRYLQRYRRFMESPVYTPELDVMVEADDGRVAAFCVAWTDATNRVGLLEPVGVHPDFQRRGLGRAVVQEALRRLMARGMAWACVNFEPDNPAAKALYLGAGFVEQYQILTYERTLAKG
jgi:ribosomal protein S18 acetylase RimI-like enzyme